MRSWGNIGFGFGAFGHTSPDSAAFGIGPWTTFTFTPGYVHGEAIAVAVDVTRFEDRSEQRYLIGAQVGLVLSYEFHFIDSGTVAAVGDFFSEAGPQRFWALDHRTTTTHLVRFSQNIAEQLRGPSMVRNLRIEFTAEQPEGSGVYGTPA